MESMMEKLCGTRTEENLRTAFAGESQARNKYTYYAKKAEEDGTEEENLSDEELLAILHALKKGARLPVSSRINRLMMLMPSRRSALD